MNLENRLSLEGKNNSYERLSKMFDYNIEKRSGFYKGNPVEIWTISHYGKKAEIIRHGNKCIYTRDL